MEGGGAGIGRRGGMLAWFEGEKVGCYVVSIVERLVCGNHGNGIVYMVMVVRVGWLNR